MEKGNSKSSSSKCNAPETKNKQDANKYVRQPRFKDSISPRPDPRRKPNPQRNREKIDKRPRNKTGAVFEKYWSEVAENPMNEIYSKQGSKKKTNLNHLLNFTLPPTNNNWDGNARPSYNRPKLPKYNKELFLQANCQFVARKDGDYAVHEKNPDILVEWSLIEEVRLPCHEVPLCPICLYVPVAAKITRCGHVYCWPCMLHYLALTDKTWQKCPICFEAVHPTDLKSVSLSVQKSFSIGDEITLCLMKREKGSLFSIPVTHQKPYVSLCHVDDVDSVTRYQKLLLASQKEIKFIMNREHCELNQAYDVEKDTPEACFIQSALKLLDERESSLNHTSDTESKMYQELPQNATNAPVRKHLTTMSSTESNDSLHLDINDNASVTERSTSDNTNNTMVQSHGTCAVPSISNESETKGISFFYQAEDGQHIYLHNINVRMLLKEYGSLEFAPHTITAKLLEIERVTMTEVLRKRLRYLQHLPLTCEFQVVELDFGSLVSESTVSQFESEVKRRKYFRNRKARDERRREKMIEQEENKKLGKYPKATYNLNSSAQFPAYDPDDFLSLSPPRHEGLYSQASNRDVSPLNINDTSLFSEATPVAASSATVKTCAQMLKDGPKTFTNATRCMKTNITQHQPQPKLDSDEEEYIPTPEFRQSFSDAIQAALDSVTLKDPSDNNQGSSKKKKKGKKQLLFTTSMCRTK